MEVNDEYSLKIEDYDIIKFYYHNKFAIYHDILYIIPEKYLKIIKEFDRYEISQLDFDSDFVDLFKDGLEHNTTECKRRVIYNENGLKSGILSLFFII